MRMMSKPGCSKKRLSSAESTAFTSRRGNILEAYAAALLPRAVEQIGQQLRLDFGAVQRGPIVETADAANFLAGKLDAQRILSGKVGVLRPDESRWRCPARKTSRLCRPNLRLGVTGHLHVAGQILRGKCLAHGDSRGRRIDARGSAVDVSGQKLVDHPAVLDPVIGEDAAAGQRCGQYERENRQRPARN